MPDLSASPPAAPVSGRPGGGSAIDGQGITPGRARNRWTLVLAGLGAFMAALDVVVVATALRSEGWRTHVARHSKKPPSSSSPKLYTSATTDCDQTRGAVAKSSAANNAATRGRQPSDPSRRTTVA